mmetsp:Transcript_40409/g.127231  ORF Transcript_40409/g.127231 Transcript_40409/m.127231 type:complete len:128 (-) Transcript_40409:242-625(-)
MVHCAWECPANAQLPEYGEAAHLQARACVEARIQPAFWCRGIVPITAWRWWPYPANENLVAEGRCTKEEFYPMALFGGRAIFFGDASGGKYAPQPRHRRVGCSVVQVDKDAQAQVASIALNVRGAER